MQRLMRTVSVPALGMQELKKGMKLALSFFKNKFIYLFVYLWLRWVFVVVRGLLIAVASLVA